MECLVRPVGRRETAPSGVLRTATLALSLVIATGALSVLNATDLAPGGDIILNEILYNPPAELGDDPLYEYVELYNRGQASVDVSGWILKDRDDDHTFRVPAGTVIPEGGYLVIARNAAALRAAYADDLPVVGDFDFALGNGGDTIRLMNAAGELVDRVEYGDDIPWPENADGDGASLERVSAVDDITDFTNFLASAIGSIGSPPGTPGALNSSAGTIAARHAVVWNEIMYHPVKDPDAETLQHCAADEYLELYNRGPNAVDLSGWSINDGVDFVFPEGTTLPSQAYLVVYAEETSFREAYGDVANAIGPYTKELDNGGEALLLVDSGGAAVDYVRYDDTPPWAVNPDGLRGSLELVDPSADNDRAQAWRESDGFRGTPGEKNSATARLEAGGGGSPPQITGVGAQPSLHRDRESILSSDEVEVKARIRDRDGIAFARLQYQIVAPGDYISRTNPRFETEWTSVEMAYQGERGTYTAVLPAFPHRTLVRYRIFASDAAATPSETWAPFQDDPEVNFGYFVYDGVPDYIASRRSGFGPLGFAHTNLEKAPIYHVIMDRSDLGEMWLVHRDPTDNTYSWRATFVFEGRVHDHCGVRLRGSWTSRYTSPKRSWKVRFNKGNRFRGRYNDGTRYPNRRGRININRGVASGLVEKLAYQLNHDSGVLTPLATLVHVRMITSEDEHEQFDGDFFGLFAEVQPIDKVLLRDNNRSLAEASSLYKMKGYPNKKHSDCDLSVADFEQFDSESRASFDREWVEQTLNLRQYFSFRACIQLTNNHDMDGYKNIGYYFDSEAGLWELLPWDLECSFRENGCSGEEPLRLRVPRLFDIEYRNRYRSIWQVQFDGARMREQFDTVSDQIRELAEADYDRWSREPRLACRSCPDGPYVAPPFDERVAWVKSYLKNRVPRSIREWSDSQVPLTPRNAFPPDGLTLGPPVRLRCAPFADHEGDAHAATHWLIIERGGDWAYPVWESTSDTHLEEIEVPAEATESGGEYLFRVAHIDATGRRSLLSEPTAFGVGTADPTPPAPPTGLVVEHAGWRSVTLSWAPPADGDATIVGYRVLRGGAVVGPHLVSGMRYTDFAPVEGAVRYEVIAVSSGGLESAPSEAVEIEVPSRGLSGWKLPTGGWEYLFDAHPGESRFSDALREARPVYLDGTWRRSSSRNDWDGTPPGDGNGGVAVEVLEGAGEDGGPVSVLSIEDTAAADAASNRRLMFTHDAGATNFLEDGITVIARLRVNPSPLDLGAPKGQSPDTSFRGQIGVGHRTGGRGHFSLWLDEGQLVTQGAGSLDLETTRFQSVWLVVEKAEDGQHRVRLFLNGSDSPAIDESISLSRSVGESGFEQSYLEMGLSNTADSGAIQIDYVGYRSGAHLPVSAGAPPQASFVRGDFNFDGVIDVSDPVLVLRRVASGVSSTCDDAGDFDDDESLGVSDAILGLNFIFSGGEPPSAPYPEPGLDPGGAGPLTCERE